MNNCRFFKLFFAVAVALFMAVPHEASAAGIFARSTPLDWSHRTQKKTPDVKTRNAVRKFSEKNGNKWTVRYNPQTGAPESLMHGKSSKRYHGRKNRDGSDLFLKENAEMLNIDVSSLKEAGETSFFGMNHLRYQQYYKGLPVEFSYTKVHMTEDGEVTGYQSSYNKDIDLDINPSVSAAQAIQTAGAASGMSIRVSSHTLVVYPDFNTDTAYLAWKIRGRSFDGLHIWVYYVDAHSGKVLFSYDDMRRAGKQYSSTAKVYDISPVPVDPYPFYQKPSTYWQHSNGRLMSKNLTDQYIWIKDYTIRTVTEEDGVARSTKSLVYNPTSKNWETPSSPDYIQGKIFSSLKGPYFSVVNFRGMSSYWNNGQGVIRSGNLEDIYRIQSPVPYPNNAYLAWSSKLKPLLNDGETFAAQYPVFNSPFEVGAMDDDGNITDEDEVFVEDNKGVRMGSYLGKRTNSFLGPSVENPEFYVKLKSDASGRHQGFTIYKSSYIVLTKNPEVDEGYNQIDWSTTTSYNPNHYYENRRFYVDTSLGAGGTFGIDEANTFYHLNKMRRYFMQFNRIRTSVNSTHSRQPVNLDGHLDVMVHANGNADEMYNKIDLMERRGLANAFYDLENNNIFFGDGIFDGINQDAELFAYRSFALDGTIIRHEYTHYVVHQIYNIINFGEFGAISEALSDYFSLASFWQEGENGEGNWMEKMSLSKVGNFVTSEPRDLSLGDKKLTLDWKGELYNDSQILSQALYELRKGYTYNLGNLGDTGSTWSNLPVADLVIWGALFYFPDSFLNLYEAMDDVCGRINSVYPGKCDRDKISGAFMDHEMITGGSTANSDEYEASAGGLCQNNNGPECASDITEKSEIQALIYPKGDLDYYTFTANSGVFTAELTLPDDGNYKFHGYMLTLYDSNRNQLMEVIPLLDSAITSDYCFSDEECRSVEQTVKLVYNIPKSGRYYLAVTAPQSTYPEGWGISPEHSEKPYVLKTSFIQQGHVTAYVDRSTYASKFDNDIIKFDAPVIMAAATSKNIINESDDDRTIVAYDNNKYAAETSFSHVQLWDIQGNKLEQASSIYTPESGRMIAIIQCPNEPSSVPVVNSTGSIRGCFQIQQGFSRRYPAVGSVVVEVIGKNHMGAQVSIGKSKPVNLIAQSSKFEAYNNVLLKGEGEAVIRFAATGSGRLTIKAYTQTGTLVKVITDREVYAGEQGNETWDGTNDKGSRVASGVYFIKAEGPGLNKIEKVAVVR